MALLTFQDVRTRQVRTASVALDNGGFRPMAFKPAPGDPPTFGAVLREVPGGLAIDHTVAGTPSALLQLDPGDVITTVNGRPVRTNPEFTAAVASSPDEMWFELRTSSRASSRPWSPRSTAAPGAIPAQALARDGTSPSEPTPTRTRGRGS